MATTFSELWEEIRTAALNEVQSLKNTLVQWEHNAVPVVEADLVLALGQFKSFAVNMITTLATAEFQNLTGGQKNAITVQTILSAAKSAGKDLAVQDAQLLAQQAYNAVLTAAGSK